MARIRTIKPEFFLHDGLADLSALHRLLFIGLWTQADREGRMDDRPKRIKAAILPYDECNVDEMLDDLQAGGFIARYQIEGVAYIEVSGFGRHQLPNRDEAPSTIPGRDGGLAQLDRAPNGTVRQRIYERDRFVCAYCGDDLKNEPRRRCVDHVIPIAKGGTHAEINLVTACKRCNEKKGARDPDEVGFPWPEGLGETYKDREPPVNPPLTPPSTSALAGREQEGKGTGREREGNREAAPSAPPAKRASRLPDDWQLPPAWAQWAEAERPDWTPAGVQRVGATFRDHWLAQGGQNARKVDWEAAWRNWVRRERAATRAPSWQGNDAAVDEAIRQFREEQDARI